MSILDQIEKTLFESGFKIESENFELQNSPVEESAVNNTKSVAAPEKAIATKQAFTCSKCGSGDAWELLTPGGSSSSDSSDSACIPWRCLHCEPPAARWMIKRVSRVDDRPLPTAQTLEALKLSPIDRYVSEGVWPQSRVTLACGRPVCGRCGSALVVELSGRDGEVAYKCWTCRGDVDPVAVRSISVLTELSGMFSR